MAFLRFFVVSCLSIFLIFKGGEGFAAPSGGTVMAGGANILQSNNNTSILQFTDKAIFNWQAFGISPNELVQFFQPGRSSIALNRVIGTDPSVILGALKANGQVWLLNPNGILFGPHATVDVGGLLASTLSIRDQDFLKGNYLFTQDPSRSLSFVVNQGTLRAADKGYVVLLAPVVDNEGSILATLGQVRLAGTSRAVLNMDNQGLINVVLSHPDQNFTPRTVVMTPDAVSSLVIEAIRNKNVVEAGRLIEQNGKMLLVRGEGIAANGGRIEVNGTTNANAGKVVLNSTQATLLSPKSFIEAKGVGMNSNGGEIRVFSDRMTVFPQGSQLNANADPKGRGNGGFVEVSSEGKMLLGGSSNRLGSGGGRSGTLLYDPKNILIDGGADSLTGNQFYSENPTGTVHFSSATIDAGLALGNLELDANTDITITTNITSTGNANQLSLNAGRSITMTGSIITLGGSLIGIYNEPTAQSANRDAGTAVFSMDSSSSIITRGNGTAGGVSITGGAFAGAVGSATLNTITTTPTAAGGVGGDVTVTPALNQNVILNGVITTSGVNNGAGAGGNSGTITINANGTTNTVTVGANLSLNGGNGTGGVGGVGGGLSVNTLNTNLNATTINAKGGTGTTQGAGGNMLWNGGPSNQAITLGANLAVDTSGIGGTNGFDVRATIDADSASNNRTLTLTGPTATFTKAIGSTTPLQSFNLTLTLQGPSLQSSITTKSGGISITPASGQSITLGGNLITNGGSVATGGPITLSGPVVLDSSDFTVNLLTNGSTSGGAVNITGAIDSNPVNSEPRDLVVNAGTGAVTFGGAIGSSTVLRSLRVTSSGTTTLQGNITTGSGGTATGNVDFSGATGGITLGSNVSIASNASGNRGGAVNFGSAIDSDAAATARILTINAGAGNITLPAIGTGTVINSLTATTTGTINVNGNITANNGMTLNSGAKLSLGNNLVSNSGLVTLNSTTGGVNQTGGMISASNLVLTGGGPFTLTSSTNSVGTLTANVSGALNFNNGASLAIGTITTGSNALILTSSGALTSSNSNIMAGNVTFSGTAIGTSTQALKGNVSGTFNATARSGSIFFANNRYLTIGTVTANGTGSSVNLSTTSGDIQVGWITANSGVFLTSAGSILHAPGGTLTAGANSSLVAKNGVIGTGSNHLWVDIEGGSLSISAAAMQSGISVDIDGKVIPSNTLTRLNSPPGLVIFNGEILFPASSTRSAVLASSTLQSAPYFSAISQERAVDDSFIPRHSGLFWPLSLSEESLLHPGLIKQRLNGLEFTPVDQQ